MTYEQNSIGGAATNKGIWFQALWVVLQAAASRIGISVASDTNGEEEVLRLVLEPDGGDVRIEYQNSRRVVQLKVKSEGTWALKELITEVLPDLYRAVDTGDEKATYEFVTEGKLEQWRAALTFFNDLGARLCGRNFDDAYAQLSRATRVRLRHQVGDFWRSTMRQRVAAAVALENHETRDRSRYPAILYRLDPVAVLLYRLGGE